MLSWRSLAVACGLTLFVAAPVSAQSIQWGMWGEPPEKRRSSGGFGSPSFLGFPSVEQTKPAAQLATGGGRPSISPKSPQSVAFANGFAPGSVIIDTAGRKLYYTLSPSAAYVYPIAVGRQGFTWTGVETVSRIESWPDWIPPAEMRQRQPYLPVRMTGGIRNPLGAKAIYLGSTLYRIHGTNDSKSIGSASSSGCFRMHNGHVVHLASMVSPGTKVYVMSRLPKGGVAMPPGGAATVQEVKQPVPATEASPADGEAPAAASPPQAETPEAKQPPAGDGQKI